MNAVIDEDLPRSLLPILVKLGFTVFDIRDHGLRGKSDDVIFSFVQQKHAVLFTADLGFSNIIRFPPGTHAGICILRFLNTMSIAAENKSVRTLLQNLTEEDYRENLIIISPMKIRIRRAH